MTNKTEMAWAWAQAQKSFTRDELAAAIELPFDQCSSIIEALKKQGCIKPTAYPTPERFKGGFTPKRYKPCKQAEYKHRGSGRAQKHRAGTGQQCVWQSMRLLRNFSYPDLVATAEVSMSTARVYTNFLIKFGYVRMVRGRSDHLPTAERAGVYAVYRLIKDTGPIAPKRRYKVLFDANLNKEIHYEVA